MSARADLIAELYEAILDPARWPAASVPLGRLVGSETGVIWLEDDRLPPETATHGLPDKAGELHAAYYGRINPWLSAAGTQYPMKALRGTDLVPESQLFRTEFYADFARPFDTVHVIGAYVPIRLGRRAAVGVHRPRRARRFSRSERDRLDAILPHLQRALQLKDRLGQIGTSEFGLAALDALAFGAIVCDAAGRILFANAAAEAAAGAGAGVVLGDRLSGLGALHAEEGRLLLVLVRDAAQGGSGGATWLTGENGARLVILVAPLPERFAHGPPLALVTMRPASASPNFPAATLATLFGLTAAEAKLVLALLAGSSLAEIGAERQVTLNTLRSQLGHILRKTGTDGQRDLVRLLGLLPPLR